MGEEQNPYKAPESNVDNVPTTGQGETPAPEPRAVDAGRGVGWFGGGWQLFKAAPGVWIANIVILFVIMMVLSLIPLVSLLTNLLSPVFMGGLMMGCRDLDRGEPLTVNHLFAGFSHRTGTLIGLGALYMVLVIVVVAIGMAFMAGMGGGMATMMDPNAGGDPAAAGAAMMIGMLVMMALLIPVIMLYWFAPALIVLHPEVGVIDAMKLSFAGCLKNILPFLVYGIIGFIIAIVATIPLGLGWLVAGPVFIGSIYAGYKEIFLGE